MSTRDVSDGIDAATDPQACSNIIVTGNISRVTCDSTLTLMDACNPFLACETSKYTRRVTCFAFPALSQALIATRQCCYSNISATFLSVSLLSLDTNSTLLSATLHFVSTALITKSLCRWPSVPVTSGPGTLKIAAPLSLCSC